MIYSMNLRMNMAVGAVPATVMILHGVPHAGQFVEIPNWHPCRIHNVLAHSIYRTYILTLLEDNTYCT